MTIYRFSFIAVILSSIIAVFFLSSCDPKEDFLTGDNVAVRLEVDTLHFDTVFTELGSATHFFKIYNDGDKAVKVDEIYVEGTSNVTFRFNADGFDDEIVRDLIIWEKDSIYVFVEVTIDPDQPLSESPFVIEDYLIVKTGTKEQSVLLEAWGQNANYFPSRYNKGVPVVLSCDNDVILWDSPLPYVIYGEIFIDSCLLQVAAGTHIYVHGGIAKNDIFEGSFNDGFLYTLPNGSIHFAGTLDKPITMEGDRLEESFSDEPGQWLGIILGKESRNNIIEYTNIKNSIFGIFADSASTLMLTNSLLHTTAGSGLIGIHCEITANNCLFYDNSSNAIQLTHGGQYEFNHCSIASYGVDASAIAMTNFQCYNDDCSVNSVFPLQAEMNNCIFFGSRKDEIIIQDATEGMDPAFFQLNMDHCLVKVDELLTRNDGEYSDFFSTFCLNCINGNQSDALFLDRAEDDYHLDTLSIAQDRGIVLPAFPFDLEGTARDDMPDLGCYERID